VPPVRCVSRGLPQSGEEVGDTATAGKLGVGVEGEPRGEYEVALRRARVRQEEVGVVADDVAVRDEI
jgi:hypothetical protein